MKCPFIEEVVVRYCKAYPIRKMIPNSGEESICLGEEHCNCSTYREVARVDVAPEEAPQAKPEYKPEPSLKGSADFFPAYWSKLCKVLNCPVCPYRFQCLGAEKKWLREPVLIHGFAILRDLYYSQWHTWMQVKSEDVIRIGLDDFSQNLLGDISGIELPEVGTILKVKEPAWKVIIDSWSIDLLSPIDGEVIEINRKLSDDLSMLNSDPQKTGWVLEIKPGNLEERAESMLQGEKAIAWLGSELDRLHTNVEEGVGETIADGGELIDAISGKIGQDEWKNLISQFLLVKALKV